MVWVLLTVHLFFFLVGIFCGPHFSFFYPGLKFCRPKSKMFCPGIEPATNIILVFGSGRCRRVRDRRSARRSGGRGRLRRLGGRGWRPWRGRSRAIGRGGWRRTVPWSIRSLFAVYCISVWRGPAAGRWRWAWGANARGDRMMENDREKDSPWWRSALSCHPAHWHWHWNLTPAAAGCESRKNESAKCFGLILLCMTGRRPTGYY